MAKKLRRKIGKSHQDEVITGKVRRSTLSFLFPTRQGLERVMQDERLSQADKARILWIEYRLSLVSFFEYVRLRYLFGSPTRS